MEGYILLLSDGYRPLESLLNDRVVSFRLFDDCSFLAAFVNTWSFLDARQIPLKGKVLQ